jgi:hypothetical protein
MAAKETYNWCAREVSFSRASRVARWVERRRRAGAAREK